MGMHVDKAGRDDQPRHIDLAGARHLRDRTDSRDPVAGDRDVAAEARRAGTVDDGAAAKDQVGHGTV